MLERLAIDNLILAEHLELIFEKGFTVLSGETGSGKSAVVQALSLLLGEKGEVTQIRRGSEKAAIEGTFTVLNPKIQTLLEESGIPLEEGTIFLRREISSQGKSRAFINAKAAPLTLLKQVGSELVQLVGQEHTSPLSEDAVQREILDTFGELNREAITVKNAWLELNGLERELEVFLCQDQERARRLATIQREWEEIENAKLKSGEDEKLFQEYSLMSTLEERRKLVNELYHALLNERCGVLQILKRERFITEKLSLLDPNTVLIQEGWKGALLELEEVGCLLRSQLSKLEVSPERLFQLETRLKEIENLKKRYGKSVEEILEYQQELIKEKEKIDLSDDVKERLTYEIDKAQKYLEASCRNLTELRKKNAKQLEEEITEGIQKLNMAKARIKIELEPKPRCIHGDEKVVFYLAANVGERLLPLANSASGGEMARITLAIKRLLGVKENKALVVFDEIDANIGGTTASLIGEALRELGLERQVISITHFPQVAKHAHFHLKVEKKEENGRVFSTIQRLNTKDIEKELLRMRGEVR